MCIEIQKEKMKEFCLVCGDSDAKFIYESNNENLARYGFLSKADNLVSYQHGLDQKIAYCEKCQFAWNTKFQYSKIKYDSGQIIEAGNFSKRYIEYQKTSAANLKKIMGFVTDVVVEIGAGAGIFIKEFEAKRKVAIEPSEEAGQIDKSIEVYNEYFTKEKFNFSADLVVMRQVLEHIQDPINFLKEIKKSFQHSHDLYIYIEVPNSTLTFRFGRFYDYYYEHCNYFSINTINFLANQLNMEVVDLSTAMDGELIAFLLTTKKTNALKIKEKLDENRATIFNELKIKQLAGKRIIAWGASGNGVQILNNLDIDTKSIPFIIDSDKNKQGKYIPGTLQKIISPMEARDYNPDVILVLTQFHKKEIGSLCNEIFEAAEVWFID